MGGGPSQPAQISDEENERIHAEFQANLEREERQRAEEERQRAEQDRLRQEEEARRKRAAEEEQRKRAEEEAARIKANTPFQKPTPPTLALTNKRSNQCQRCDIVIPPGLSSSTVILSRHIISGRPKAYPTPKEPPPGKYKDTLWEKPYLNNFLVPTFLQYDERDMWGSEVLNPTIRDNMASIVPSYRGFDISGIYWMDLAWGNQPVKREDGKLVDRDRSEWKSIPKFKCAFPDKKFPEVWVDGRPETDEIKTFGEAMKLLEEQYAELTTNISKRNNPEMETVLWNPSETKGENGAVAINYKTHGALTKVFLKPTIPFSITYGTAIDVDKAARKAEEAEKKQREEAKKKKEEDKKKAEEDSKKAKK